MISLSDQVPSETLSVRPIEGNTICIAMFVRDLWYVVEYLWVCAPPMKPIIQILWKVLLNAYQPNVRVALLLF